MLGFIIALIAGFATPWLETPLARPLARAMKPVVPVQEKEIVALSFILAMLIGALLCAIFSTGTPFWFILGGALGLGLMRLVAAAKAALDKAR